MNISEVTQEKKYFAISELHKEKSYSISSLCGIAGVARSSYYKWLKRQPSKREKENTKLSEEIKDLYDKVKGIYGYRRITININHKLDKNYNHKRIYRLMKIMGLKSIIRKKRKRYGKSKPQYIAENLLNREFSASKTNEKWVTDVTEFKYGNNSKAYLSAILDLYDNSIVSYVISNKNDNKLVFNTIDLAIEANPKSTPMIHSDRGYQYTSHGFKKRIQNANMVHSMSRPGRCIDNGPMESFWGILKSEKYYLNKYNNFADLRRDIDNDIYFYNYKRLQKRLNSLSPVEYRAMAA
ncbi:IS3 family transposase [Garciella nitratireducens]|uniref:Transposase InsO and inactivated derivatives n=1 Tax=Garciella nitratireducens DSM 15102 TaxID=1121911 RepID=A0A1T4M141_9FIRM|nr:IS3 family transposase [Garciella nitratireducens]SJZ60605.1 Transposase InsO and inactivated derivatives [Garciella nitratireducens DSM 15102]